MKARGVVLISSLLLGACSSADAPPSSAPRASSGDPPAQTQPGASVTDGGAPSGPNGDAGATTKNNGFPTHWNDGTSCASEPDVQVWAYDDATTILRQSLCTHYEGPFLYLLVGASKALLVDTGTGDVDLRAEIDKLLAGKNVELVVAHSHAHGDHVGADAQLSGRPSTTVVGKSVTAVRQFFGLGATSPGAFDLGGGRVVDVVPIPGHQAAHVAFYDRQTRLLLSGDTLYPGRLYIDDWSAYQASVARLVAFVDAGHPVSFVLGGHIELPETGADFPLGSKSHPNEHVLQLGDAELRDLDATVQAMGPTPVRKVRPHFIVSP